MAETSAAATVLNLLAERVSLTDTSSSDSNSSIMPSPSSAATSFELLPKSSQHQVVSSFLLPAKDTPGQAASAPQSELLSAPPLSFLTLSSDIHHLILTEYLPYNSIVALRSTSSYFRSLISPSTLKRLRQRVITSLFVDERAILEKWFSQPDGRFDGRPSPYMTCYSCLQSLPTTEFSASQVTESRGIGRKHAVKRWCKPCGLKYGRIRHGKWIQDINYGDGDMARYETVMGQHLKLENLCAKCPSRKQIDGQPLWWGCVDCFKKEEKRLQKRDSEYRRDVRWQCSRVKQAVEAFVEPANLRELGQEVWWWMRANVGWHALVHKGHTVYWWIKEENVLTRVSRTCSRVGRVLDPRKMQEPGQKLSRRAKRAVDMCKKDKEKEEGSNTTGETSPACIEDCIICCKDLTQSRVTAVSSLHSHHHHHIPLPHREVRCRRCWQIKRSYSRFCYNYAFVCRLPLPKGRWCDGCQAEHERFVERFRKKGMGGDVQRKTVLALRTEVSETGESREDSAVNEEEEDAELGLSGLFGED